MDVLGGASSPWVTRESTYIGFWTCLANRPSVPCARRNGASCLDERQQLRCRASSESYFSSSCMGCIGNPENVGDTCCQRQQSCLPELRSRPMFQNRRGGSVETSSHNLTPLDLFLCIRSTANFEDFCGHQFLVFCFSCDIYLMLCFAGDRWTALLN